MHRHCIKGDRRQRPNPNQPTTMPQNPDYIPSTDSGLGTWADNFSTLLTAAPTDYGLVAGNATDVSAVVAPFVAALALATNPATKTAVTVAAKDAAKSAMLAVVRPFATTISSNANVLSGDKTAIGVTNRILTRTRNSVVAVNAEGAVGFDSGGNWKLRAFNPDTPDSAKRPLGAYGWEIQVQVKPEATSDPWELALDVVSTKPIYILNPDLVAGIAVRFRVRWVGPSLNGGAENAGPWSAWVNLVEP